MRNIRIFLLNRSPSRDARSIYDRRCSNNHGDQATCYYFLTQCWIEPQDGFVQTTCPELEFLNGCTYREIIDKVSRLALFKSLKSEHVNHH